MLTISSDEQRKAAFGTWGWEQEYSDFFLAELAKGRPILWACAPDVLPSIHAWRPEDGDEQHLGFGCFRIRKDDFDAHFDAGGAMHNHGPISYTTVDVRKGKMPAWYDAAKVHQTLLDLKAQAAHFDALAAQATQTDSSCPQAPTSRPTPASNSSSRLCQTRTGN